MSTDALGRLRTANPFTIFNYYPSIRTSTNLDQDIWYSSVGGTSTQTYNTDNYVAMTINNNNDYCIRLTKSPMEYQPGKSRLILNTCVPLFGTVGSNIVTSRIGIFNIDSSTPPQITDGIYFQTNGSNLQFCESISALSTVTTVNQSNWNIDIFDGNGPSGKILTIANLQTTMLLAFDQEWLGVGSVRCGFNIDGVLYYAHQFFNSGLSIQYSKTPRLNIGFYILGTTVNSPLTLR